LSARVEDLRLYNRATPAERVAGSRSEVAERLQRLIDIRDDKLFSSLKPDQQQFIHERIEELTSYLEFFDRILRESDLSSEQTEEALAARIQRLNKELAVPEQWKGTQADEVHRRLLDRAEALRRGAETVRDWYSKATAEVKGLWSSAG